MSPMSAWGVGVVMTAESTAVDKGEEHRRAVDLPDLCGCRCEFSCQFVGNDEESVRLCDGPSIAEHLAGDCESSPATFQNRAPQRVVGIRVSRGSIPNRELCREHQDLMHVHR